jgi:uncharacterized membrane protein
MSNKEYKEALDAKIKELSGQVNIVKPSQCLTLSQKISDACCIFLGAGSWIWWLTAITAVYMILNSISIIAWDVYPYPLYTMIISVWALYSNVFVQMGSNRVMEQLIWGIEQDSEVNKRSELSLLLLHQKFDLYIEQTRYK